MLTAAGCPLLRRRLTKVCAWSRALHVALAPDTHDPASGPVSAGSRAAVAAVAAAAAGECETRAHGVVEGNAPLSSRMRGFENKGGEKPPPSLPPSPTTQPGAPAGTSATGPGAAGRQRPWRGRRRAVWEAGRRASRWGRCSWARKAGVGRVERPKLAQHQGRATAGEGDEEGRKAGGVGL